MKTDLNGFFMPKYQGKNIFLEIKQSENELELKNIEKVKALLRAIKVE